MEITRIDTSARMSQAVVHNGVIRLAGQVGDGVTVAEQTTNALAAVDDLLARCGSDRSRLLSATIWLTDLAGFDEMNGVWEAWLLPGSAPTRATAQVRLTSPAYLVEVMITAAVAP